MKGRTGAQQNSRNGSKGKNQTQNYGPNHDLNLRLDFSFRKQAAIVRDIATMTSSASSGNNALKLSFTADYTLSKMLTMSFYYDRQTNTPALVEQQLSYHYAGFRSEHQVLADEIGRIFLKIKKARMFDAFGLFSILFFLHYFLS